MRIDYESVLNPEQYEAVTITKGPLLILAGAGTGKTRTIVYRASYLIEIGVASSEILMLTFTNKAANEMKARVAELLGGDVASDITACTFHSFCVRMLRRFYKYANLDPDFTILDTSDDSDIINIIKAEAAEHEFDLKGFPPSAKIAAIISMMVNKDCDVADVLSDPKFAKFASFEEQILEIKNRVQKYKENNSMLDYDDMLVRMNKMLSEHPEIAKKISDIYTYIMVDEYQDTNTLQDYILYKLRKDNHNLAVVGDDMQSLYGFRGADVMNIINFPERMEECRIVKLIRNYRSNQEILDLANYVTQNATEGYRKELIGTYSAAIKPIVYRINSQQDEVDRIMSIIYRLHAQEGLKYDDICILSRNSYLTAGLEIELKKGNIDFVKYGGQKFFELEYVKTALSYMRVLVREEDEIAWFRILKLYPGIGDKTARAIAENCKISGRKHLLNKSFAHRKYGDGLRQLYDKLEELITMPFKDLLEDVINFYHDIDHDYIMNMNVSKEELRFEYLDANERHLELLLNNLMPLAEKYKTITEFLDDLLLDNTAVTQNKPTDGSIVVSTIHSVKGLEFKAVIMMDCVDEVFPSTTTNEIGTKEDNEELRCFYVAATRAKQYLYLMCPEWISMYNRQIRGTISHYLSGGMMYYDVHS